MLSLPSAVRHKPCYIWSVVFINYCSVPPSSKQCVCSVWQRHKRSLWGNKRPFWCLWILWMGPSGRLIADKRNKMPAQQWHPWDGQVSAAAEGNDDDDNIDACQLQSAGLHNVTTCQQDKVASYTSLLFFKWSMQNALSCSPPILQQLW